MRPWDGTFNSKRALPVEQIDNLLVQLAARCRFSDEAIRKKRHLDVKVDMELKDILVRLESWEAKWFVRLILRDHCTVGLEENFVLERYHFLLPELLMFQNDFDAVFKMLRSELSCYPPVPEPTKQQYMRLEAAQKLRAIVGIKVGRPTFHKAWSLKHCIQLVGQRAWAAEVKYDGEYCEIHIDLDRAPNHIQIYSKNGKDATADRRPLHATIYEALRIGRPDCKLKKKCIVLGEMVLYSDRERRIMAFSKLRKQISRSGCFIGTLQDSLPHEWEHLMIVFFDVLVLDDELTLRHCLQDRRKILRDLVHVVPGRSMRSEWTLLDFCQDKTGDGITDLKQIFARNLAERQEGLILKPLHAPYFPLLSEQGHHQAGFFIKLKKDYLADMGGERDLGDFAVIGADFDAQTAPKTNIKPLHWTHFHLGCCLNKDAVERTGAKPKFMVVASLSLDKCIPKSDVKYMNIQGYVRQSVLQDNGSTAEFDIQYPKGYERRMTTVFKRPFVAEVLGGGFEKLQNEWFEMLRHPRVKKIHHDRSWEDAVCLEDLERMAEEKWELPDADKLDGHTRDIALLAKKYIKEMGGSQSTMKTDDTTQQTTPRSSPISPGPTITRTISQSASNRTVVQETQEYIYTSVSTSHGSADGSTQGKGTRASRELRVLVREDTSERLGVSNLSAPISTASKPDSLSLHKSSATSALSNINKRSSFMWKISPPDSKRRKALAPLRSSGGKRDLGGFDYDSQEGTIHIYTRKGVKVQVHTGSQDKEHKS